MSSRVIAIGDVHGCSAPLAALIEAIDPRPDDTIVMLGDYVDRGPDTKGVIELLIALKGHCKLVALLGNHEEMLLRSLDDPATRADWLMFGGHETCESYGGGLRDILEEHIDFMESCMNFYEIDTHFFVHACYYPEAPLDEQPETVVRWRSLRDGLPGPHRSGKVAVVGHTSQKTGAVLDAGHIVCIDTYCFGGGWLTAYEPKTGQVWQADEFGNLREGPPDFHRPD